MKKIITAILLTAFCLQTTGCSALAHSITPVQSVDKEQTDGIAAAQPTADNRQFVSALQPTLDNELIAATENWDWDNYPSNVTEIGNNPTSTKKQKSTITTDSMTYDNKPQSTSSVDMTGLGTNPTSIKITGTMTKEQKQKAFKKIMNAKGYDEESINRFVRYIKWDIIDENTIQDTLAFYDLLKKYGYSYAYFLQGQKKITRKEFNQICENIEIITNDKYSFSKKEKNYLIEELSWEEISKPIAPSFFELRKNGISICHNNIRRYINDEKMISAIINEYHLMIDTGFLMPKYAYEAITEWNALNGTNYVLKISKLIKDTNSYSIDEINKIIAWIDWEKMDNDTFTVLKSNIQKGYLGYLLKLYGKVPVDKEILTKFEQVLDIMMQNNFSDDTIRQVLGSYFYYNYKIGNKTNGGDETIAFLKHIIKRIDILKHNDIDTDIINAVIKSEISETTSIELKNIVQQVNFMKQNNVDTDIINTVIKREISENVEITPDELKNIVQQVNFMKQNNVDTDTINAVIKREFSENIETTPDELKNIVQLINFMKENSFDEDTIKGVIYDTNWKKSDETLAILKILVEQGKTPDYIYQIFCKKTENKYTVDPYKIYASVQMNDRLKDKSTEYVKQFDKETSEMVKQKEKDKQLAEQYKKNMERVNATLRVLAIITLPIWLPLIGVYLFVARFLGYW